MKTFYKKDRIQISHNKFAFQYIIVVNSLKNNIYKKGEAPKVCMTPQ